MTALRRYRVQWTGMPGGPGVTTIYTADSSGAALGLLHTFFLACQPYVPADVTIKSPDTAGDIIDDATGAITGRWTDSGFANIVCANANVYNAAGGAMMRLLTNNVRGRRRVQGRWFLVPWGAYQSDGTILDAAVTAMNNAGNTLALSSAGPYVWHRPSAPGASDGQAYGATNLVMPDKSVVLRSRRDT